MPAKAGGAAAKTSIAKASKPTRKPKDSWVAGHCAGILGMLRPDGITANSMRSYRGLGLAALSVALAAGCGDRALHPFFRDLRRPYVFAHRGGGGLEPEATVPAMLHALERNPEAVVEFDVHATRDAQLVVIHDETVDRTTEATGKVADLTLAELQALDAGYCATPGDGNGTAPEGECHGADPAGFPFRGQGYYRIPTLDEVLAALPQETPISVEVKRAGIERLVADALRAAGRATRLIAGAEFDEMSVRLEQALPEVPHYYPTGAATCLALCAKLGWSYAACPHYEAFASPLTGAGLALDTRGVLAAAHREGVAVIYWTINDEPTMERLFRLGADGIYTDYPDRARDVIERLRAGGVLK